MIIHGEELQKGTKMKKILLIAQNDVQGNEWFNFLKEHLKSEPNFKITHFWKIIVGDFDIIIIPNRMYSYMGYRPKYHYAYGSEVNEYLLAVGSKRLTKMEEVIDIVKRGKI